MYIILSIHWNIVKFAKFDSYPESNGSQLVPKSTHTVVNFFPRFRVKAEIRVGVWVRIMDKFRVKALS